MADLRREAIGRMAAGWSRVAVDGSPGLLCLAFVVAGAGLGAARAVRAMRAYQGRSAAETRR